MNRNAFVNGLLGLIGATLVITSLVMVSGKQSSARKNAGKVNLREAGESYCARTQTARRLMVADRTYGELGLSDVR